MEEQQAAREALLQFLAAVRATRKDKRYRETSRGYFCYLTYLGYVERELPTKPLGKYGRLRRAYLQEHRKAIFNHLVLSEMLFSHLNEVDEQAQYLLNTMMPQMVKFAGATEQLKATEQMWWVGLMNAVKAQVEEIIFVELIYR